MHPSTKIKLEAHLICIMDLDHRIRELQENTSIDLIRPNDAGISSKPKEIKDKVENAATNLIQLGILKPFELSKTVTNPVGLLDLAETITSADDPLYRARANMIENGRVVAYARAFFDLGKRAQSLSLAGPAAAALGTVTIVAGAPGIAVAATLVTLMQHKAMANIARQLANLKNYQKMDELIEERQEHVRVAQSIAGHLKQEKAPLLSSLGRSFKVLMRSTKTGNPSHIRCLSKGKAEDLVIGKSSIDLIKVLQKQNAAIERISKEVFSGDGDPKFPSYADFDDKGQATIRYTDEARHSRENPTPTTAPLAP